ncbi:MAG: hypothetical protein DRQ78_11905, partial [Epsilonproteobacteria bacterium]
QEDFRSFIGKLSGAAVKEIGFEKGSSVELYGGMGIVAVFGGISSEATGGKFSDGAVQAAVVYLYNDLGKINEIKKYTLGIHTNLSSGNKGFKDGHAWISITNNKTGQFNTYSLFSEILNHKHSTGELKIDYELSRYFGLTISDLQSGARP